MVLCQLSEMDRAQFSDDASSHDGTAPLTLPPKPKANRAQQLREELRGIALIGILIVGFVGLATAIAVTRPPSAVTWGFAAAAYVEAAIAVLCLTRILRSDLGVIRRSADTSFPMPPVLAARLAAGELLDGLPNPRDGSKSYCVRCCVWRPNDAHHCSTCQRCVAEFDHHCGVLGRCIGGSFWGWRGNMPYFVMLLATGAISASTAVLNVAVNLPPHGWYACLLFLWCGVGACGQCVAGCCRRDGACCFWLSRLDSGQHTRILCCCCPASFSERHRIPEINDFTAADAQRIFTAMEHAPPPDPMLPVAVVRVVEVRQVAVAAGEDDQSGQQTSPGAGEIV